MHKLFESRIAAYHCFKLFKAHVLMVESERATVELEVKISFTFDEGKTRDKTS